MVMKRGSMIVEYQDLETHRNLIKDFTGSRVRMSITTSCGRRSDDKFLSLDFIENSVRRFLVFGQPKLTKIIGNQLVLIGFWFLDLGFGPVELVNEAIETEKLRKKREESIIPSP